MCDWLLWTLNRIDRFSGDEGARTPNPRLAKAVLSQLSYVPGRILHFQWSHQDSNLGPRRYQRRALTN